MALLSVNKGIELLYVYCCQLGLEHNHDIGSRPFFTSQGRCTYNVLRRTPHGTNLAGQLISDEGVGASGVIIGAKP